MTQNEINQSSSRNILLTPGEAARLNIETLGQSDSDGLGALGVPAVFKSPDMLYRIRLTILNRMGSTTPGRSLEVKQEEFLAGFQNSVTFSTHHMLKAQWKYVERMRDVIYQSLRSVIALGPPKRDFEAASLLRAFVQPLRQRGERADFELFRAYVGGFIDLETTLWLEQIWKRFQIDRPQTFWRRISIALNHLFKKT
jgi:hypothetical protein